MSFIALRRFTVNECFLFSRILIGNFHIAHFVNPPFTLLFRLGDFFSIEKCATNKMLSRLIVSQQSMLSMALGRSSISKMPIRNQFFREFHQQGRETISRSERIVQRQTTLKERIMAPAGPKGAFFRSPSHSSVCIIICLIHFIFSVRRGTRCIGRWRSPWLGSTRFLWTGSW